MFDFNSLNKLNAVKMDFQNLNGNHDYVGAEVNKTVDSVKNTVGSFIQGFCLHKLIKDATEVISGLEENYSNLQGFDPNKVIKIPDVGESLQDRIANVGNSLPLPKKEDIKESNINSIIPNPPQRQNISKETAGRLLNQTGVSLPNIEGDHSSTGSLFGKILGQNLPLLDVVNNGIKIVDDLKSISNIHKDIKSISDKSGKALQNIEKEPYKALSSLCGQMKQVATGYSFSHDKNLSFMSQISSVKDFISGINLNDCNQLKTKLNQSKLTPALPGNLFNLATGSALKNQLNALKTSNPNTPESELLVSLIPKYFVGDNDDINNLLDPSKIKQNPDEDLFNLIPVFANDSTNTQRFKELKELDKFLGEMDLSTAYKIVSYAVQTNYPVTSIYVWLAYLKTLVAKYDSFGEAVILAIMERVSLESNSTLRTALQWLLNDDQVPLNLDSLNFFFQQQRQLDADLDLALTLSETYTTTKLYNLQAAFAGVNSNNFVNTLSAIKNSGGGLGFQATLLLICMTSLERVKIICDDTTISPESLKEDMIKKICNQGFKFSSYLYNGAHIKKAFKDLGGIV
jgi:hypothetical protein